MSDSGTRDRELDEREAEVLRALIRGHVLSGEPIGSKTVARELNIRLSPATVRSVMVSLEERGLLRQPHTSAGRVPTDQAYRFYVDHLMREPKVLPSQALAIEQALTGTPRDLPALLGEASRQLSLFSHQVGLVMAPEISRILVDHLEFVRIDSRRVVAILVGRSGVVQNRIIENGEPLEQSELDRIGRYLTEEFGGRTLPGMRALLAKRLQEERVKYDQLCARSLELGRRALEKPPEGEVFVEGTSNLVGAPDFGDLDEIRSLLQTLEQKESLLELLSQLLGGDGVQVMIGEENPVSDLARCSVVAAGYGAGERTLGTLGIVGPTRMGYARAIALVDHLAKVVSRLLSERSH